MRQVRHNLFEWTVMDYEGRRGEGPLVADGNAADLQQRNLRADLTTAAGREWWSPPFTMHGCQWRLFAAVAAAPRSEQRGGSVKVALQLRGQGPKRPHDLMLMYSLKCRVCSASPRQLRVCKPQAGLEILRHTFDSSAPLWGAPRRHHYPPMAARGPRMLCNGRASAAQE